MQEFYKIYFSFKNRYFFPWEVGKRSRKSKKSKITVLLMIPGRLYCVSQFKSRSKELDALTISILLFSGAATELQHAYILSDRTLSMVTSHQIYR